IVRYCVRSRSLNGFEVGAQQWRIDGGSHLLCEALADRLGEQGRLRHPVSALDQDADEVVVHCVSAVDGTRSEYRADHVVVAIPPLLAQRIEFRPALPAPRATAATGRGCAIKVHLSYSAPIWREQGLSGWSVSAHGPLLSTVDDSPPDESAGVLTGFVTGAAASAFSALSSDEQRDAALALIRPRVPPVTHRNMY